MKSRRRRVAGVADGGSDGDAEATAAAVAELPAALAPPSRSA